MQEKKRGKHKELEKTKTNEDRPSQHNTIHP